MNQIPGTRKNIFIELHTRLETEEFRSFKHSFTRSNIMTDLARSFSGICSSESDLVCRNELLKLTARALLYIEQFDRFGETGLEERKNEMCFQGNQVSQNF